jgi:hypothetical protein
MYDTKMDIVKALAAMPRVLEALLPGVLAAAARGGAPAGAPGAHIGWAAPEILCHLRDAEERALERMRVMRDREDPFLEAYDQDAWARERAYAAADPRAALAAFSSFRAAHAAELEALPWERWERTGRHAEMGRITITTHTLHIVSHDLNHLAQLARRAGG